VVLVDHDVHVLQHADYLIELGPLAGSEGGNLLFTGDMQAAVKSKISKIAPFMRGGANCNLRQRASMDELFAFGTIHLETNSLHTVKPLQVDIPKGRLTVVTGVSGSGKTTMVLECLMPALTANAEGSKLPPQVRIINAEGVRRANLIDASPIGINIRSTVATYSGVLDELRKLYAATDIAKEKKWKAGAFSYNTGKLRCPTCDGTGQISLDVQFLPDVTITCPDCNGQRYSEAAKEVHWQVDGLERGYTLPEILSLTVKEALPLFANQKKIYGKLSTLDNLGLGYLTLGEDTPALSGGEAQRLKLASEMGRSQADSVFIFDEPTIGLHPLDVQVLLQVFDRLVAAGATVIVIEHDLDVIINADYLIDMGPEGGEKGGRIVACGTPEMAAESKDSITGKYIAREIGQQEF
ncbi:MAG: ATP-binding cassette domain-containing protein, partial [Anaerovibrio sp.]|nr:ATP-binding cassette domain-containing protein [Anaerovibrio sp.]